MPSCFKALQRLNMPKSHTPFPIPLHVSLYEAALSSSVQFPLFPFLDVIRHRRVKKQPWLISCLIKNKGNKHGTLCNPPAASVLGGWPSPAVSASIFLLSPQPMEPPQGQHLKFIEILISLLRWPYWWISVERALAPAAWASGLSLFSVASGAR